MSYILFKLGILGYESSFLAASRIDFADLTHWLLLRNPNSATHAK